MESRNLKYDCNLIDRHAGFHISTPKTKNSTRVNPLIPKVAEVLHSLYEESSDGFTGSDLSLDGYHGFVFRNRFGSFVETRTINQAINRICKEINLLETKQAKIANEHLGCCRISVFTIFGIRFVQDYVKPPQI